MKKTICAAISDRYEKAQIKCRESSCFLNIASTYVKFEKLIRGKKYTILPPTKLSRSSSRNIAIFSFLN